MASVTASRRDDRRGGSDRRDYWDRCEDAAQALPHRFTVQVGSSLPKLPKQPRRRREAKNRAALFKGTQADRQDEGRPLGGRYCPKSTFGYFCAPRLCSSLIRAPDATAIGSNGCF